MTAKEWIDGISKLAHLQEYMQEANKELGYYAYDVRDYGDVVNIYVNDLDKVIKELGTEPLVAIEDMQDGFIKRWILFGDCKLVELSRKEEFDEAKYDRLSEVYSAGE